MLRITVHSCLKTLRLVVEGRLGGAHVLELETRWQRLTASATKSMRRYSQRARPRTREDTHSDL